MSFEEDEFFYFAAGDYLSHVWAENAPENSRSGEFAASANALLKIVGFSKDFHEIWDNPNYTDEVKEALTVLVVANNFTFAGMVTSIPITYAQAWEAVNGVPDQFGGGTKEEFWADMHERFPETFGINPNGTLIPPTFVSGGVPSEVVPPTTPDGPPSHERPAITGDILTPINDAETQTTPLIVDLDSDGVEATAFNAATTTTFFDFDSDGFAQQTAWVGADDGLLVRDLNLNGTIDNGSELFGSPTIDGFALLAQLDSNGDLLINASDTAWTDLLIWKDANGDAVSQSSELHTLGYHNITSIDLGGVTASTSTVNGNPISHTSTVTKNGSTAAIADVWFVNDHMNTIYEGDYTVDPRVLSLPTLRGFGKMPDLHVAMSQNEDLLELVQDFVVNISLEDFASNGFMDSDIETILLTWAGVEDTTPGTRGPKVDAARLEFLEQFVGEEWTGYAGIVNPAENAGAMLNSAFLVALNAMKSQLLIQTVGQQLFSNDLTYNVWTGEIDGTPSLDEDAIGDLVDYATAPGVDAESFWLAVTTFIHYVKDVSTLTMDEETWLDDAMYASDPSLNWEDIEELFELSLDPFHYTIINGTSGDDTGGSALTGTNLNDYIYGNAGNDELYGLDGHDQLEGGDGNDTLSPGLGGNTVLGGNGNDTYVYSGGDDMYTEYLTGTDVIQMPVGVTLSDLTIARLGLNAMLITVDGYGTIQLNGQIDWPYSDKFETILFSDTSTLNLTTYSGDLTTYGTNGNDTLTGVTTGAGTNDTIYGYGGTDNISAGSGNDTVDSGAGNDTINLGDGDDTLIASAGFDTVSVLGGTDTLLIPVGYDAEDVEFVRLASSPYHLMATIAGLGQIQFFNHYNGSGNVLDYIQFASGGSPISIASLSIATVGSESADGLTESATNANDIMFGRGGNDTLNAHGGDDIVDGGDGNDTIYTYGGDDVVYFSNGNDWILESYSSTNVTGDAIRFGAGVDPGTISVYRDAGTSSYWGDVNSLIIADNNGNTLGVYYQFQGGGYTFERIEFEGGPTWDLTTMQIETRGTNSGETLTGISAGGSIHDLMYGYDGNDTLYGDYPYGSDVGNDLLDGGAGDDTLYGQAGNDVLYGGTGNDTIDGGADTDTVNYSLDTAAVTVNLATGSATDGNGNADTLSNIEKVVGSNYNDTLTGGTGNDELDGGSGNDTISGAAGDDILTGGSGTDTLTYASAGTAITLNLATATAQNTGGAGSDTVSGFENLTGSAFNDTLTGDGNANVIEGLAGNDTLNGAGGTDLLTYASAGAGVTVNLATTTAQNTVGAGTDTITNFENLIGSAFNDTLTGNSGANIIDGLAGDDTLNGAGGTDTLTYASAGAGITINLATTTAQNTGGAGTDTISNFENLTGSAFNDTLTGTSGANVIEGLAGDDTMNGQGGTDTLTYASAGAGITINLATTTAQNTGGAGTDTISNFENLTGSVFNDTLTGSSGNNVIEGGAGDDTMNGQGGTDTLTYANASGAITLSLAITTAQNTDGAGTDTVSNFENLTGSAFDDVLTGSTAANTINGGGGNDAIEGGAGNDILVGGNGTDTASYANAGSAVTVNLTTTTGQNTVGAGTDTLSGFENLTGSAFNDTLTGNSSANTIMGGAGNDTINGGGGNDFLYGGAGQDTLTGSTGGDVFLFESASAFSNVDTITDFSTAAGDKIDVHDVIDLGFDPLTGPISDFVNFTNSGGNSIMSIDRDGTGSTYAFTDVATLNGVTDLDEVALYSSGSLLAA